MARPFEAYVRVDASGCHLWTGAKVSDGYGWAWDREEKRRTGAHRLAWKRTHGPIPAGMSVLHRCDVRACVNPEHLFLGSQAENVQDAARKGRMRAPIGEDQHAAKLSVADVRMIRTLRAEGAPPKQLARLYGVTSTNIHHVTKRKSWRHVA